MKAFLFFTYFLLSIFGLGNASATNNNTLYFQSTRSLQYGTTMTQDINRKYLTPKQTQLNKVDPTQLSSFVKKIHDSVCSTNNEGSARIWVAVDNNGNLIVSARAATGFEIIIQCKKSS